MAVIVAPLVDRLKDGSVEEAGVRGFTQVAAFAFVKDVSLNSLDLGWNS